MLQPRTGGGRGARPGRGAPLRRARGVDGVAAHGPRAHRRARRRASRSAPCTSPSPCPSGTASACTRPWRRGRPGPRGRSRPAGRRRPRLPARRAAPVYPSPRSRPRPRRARGTRGPAGRPVRPARAATFGGRRPVPGNRASWMPSTVLSWNTSVAAWWRRRSARSAAAPRTACRAARSRRCSVGRHEEVVGVVAGHLGAVDAQIVRPGVGHRDRLRVAERLDELLVEVDPLGELHGRPRRRVEETDTVVSLTDGVPAFAPRKSGFPSSSIPVASALVPVPTVQGPSRPSR